MRASAIVIASLLLVGCSAAPESGRYLGFIRGAHMQGEQLVISADRAEWLTGEKAKAALQRDQHCTDCEPPNDFYIDNPDTATVEYVVSERDAFVVLDATVQKQISMPEFLDRITTETGAIAYPYTLIPFWFNIADGHLELIEEQYVP